MTEAIYVGRRVINTGKVTHAFVTMAAIIEIETQVASRQYLKDYPSEVTELIERKLSYFTLKQTPGMIGGVYLAGEIEGNSVTRIAAMPSWQRSSDLPYIPAWRAADQNAYEEKRKSQFEKKSEGDKEFAHAIETLRNRYAKIMPGDRIGFQVWLINQMVRK